MWLLSYENNENNKYMICRVSKRKLDYNVYATVEFQNYSITIVLNNMIKKVFTNSIYDVEITYKNNIYSITLNTIYKNEVHEFEKSKRTLLWYWRYLKMKQKVRSVLLIQSDNIDNINILVENIQKIGFKINYKGQQK
jgi:hypothetical protein